MYKRDLLLCAGGIIIALTALVLLLKEPEETKETAIYVRAQAVEGEINADVVLYPNGSGLIRFYIHELHNKRKATNPAEESCISLSTNRIPTTVLIGEPGEKYGEAQNGVCGTVYGGGPSPDLRHFLMSKITDPEPWMEVHLDDLAVNTATGYMVILVVRVSDEEEKPLPFSVNLIASPGYSLSESFPKPKGIRIYSPRTSSETKQFGGPPFRYLFGPTKGELLAKWELYDSTRIHNREVLLVLFATLLGVGVTLIGKAIVGYCSRKAS